MTLARTVRRIRGGGIRIQVTVPTTPVTPAQTASSMGSSTALSPILARLLGGLLVASEALPFIDGDSNGLLHAAASRAREAKNPSVDK